MSGHKRMRRQHQKQLISLENRLKAEMDQHRLRLQKELETHGNNSYEEMERLARRHAAQTDKEIKSSLLEENRIQLQVVSQQKKELSSFLENQKKDYRLCKDKTRDEVTQDAAIPKEEKQEHLSRHKETMQRSQAEEEARLLGQQRALYDRTCRALKRRSVVKRHQFEQEQIREELNKKRIQKEMEHALQIRQDESTQDLERRQLLLLQTLRTQLVRMQHQTELENQEEYDDRRQRELHRKHSLEQRQQPRTLKMLEVQIKKQFQDTCKVQNKQYKALRNHQMEVAPKGDHRLILKALKEEQTHKLALLAEQYQHSIHQMMASQTTKTKSQMESQHEREQQKLEQKISIRRAHLEEKVEEEQVLLQKDRSERIKQLLDRQERESDGFHSESSRLGFGSLGSVDFKEDHR
ncbi:hypothetical protein NHX12_027127 [Muraenolepis orangiensis]|uniref:non-specific serine/threonine protein kinase n=1 Tax=Muraenolepis orangiensis TaxID=630683 RepID=A0A9Q0EBT5_9TELE|nr:hypothetical protein NHX12_027127 [Muraenolepis orangiensis]